MASRPLSQLPMSPPVPQPAPQDINDVLSRYLPATNQVAANSTATSLLPGLAEVATPTATTAPAGERSASFTGRTPSQHLQPSPYHRVEREAAKEEAELLADRAVTNASKPLLVDTPDTRLYNRGVAAASEASAGRYSQAGANVRSPNSAEFRVRYSDPTPDEALTALRLRVREVEELEDKYSTDVEVFRKQAEIDRREKTGLVANLNKLRTQVVLVEEAKDHVEAEKQVALARRDEDCNRKILNMRKSLLLSEQTLGSLRSENEELAAKAAALDVQREECEALRRQIFTQNQNMTLLAQQNEQLQRALKRKETDTQADLDVYVKQLDLVQSQAAAMKKEMEVMTIKLRAQETLQEEIETLRQQNLDLQGAINEVDKEAAELQEKHTMSMQEKEDECAREVLNFRRQVLALEKQVESLTLQNQHLVNKNRPQQIAAEINQLTEQLQAVTDELDQKNRQNEAFQRAIMRKDEERNQDVSELQAQLEAARKKINEGAGEFKAAQLSKEALESEIHLLKARSDDLRVERDKIESEMLSRCRELQCQVDVLEHRANTNMNEADTMRALTAAMEEKHRAATELLNAKHQAELREALKRKDDSYADVIADHVKQLEISSRLTASVRTDNSSLSQELAKVSSEMVQMDALKFRVSTLEAQLTQKEEEATADLQTFNAQAESLTRELNQVRAERDDARADLFAAQQHVEELRRIADSVPELESELEAVREKVISMNSEAIKSQKAYAAHIDELQNQIGVYERQLNDSFKASSSTRELEFAVKQRQLAAENEKLREIIKQHLGGSVAVPPTAVSPTRDISSPPTADPLPDFGASQSLRARTGSPGVVVNVDEGNGKVSVAPRHTVPLVPPLELAKALGNASSPHQGSPQFTVSRGGSLYDSISDAGANVAPVAQRAGSEETVDSLLYGRPISYGNQPQNSMRFDPIPRLFEQAATLMGDTVAIRHEKRQGEWDDVTWRQYYLKSFNFAKALVAEDIQPFQGVVLCASNGPEWMSAFCGSIFSGALPVACHPGWGPRHCFRIASECNAHLIIVDSGKSLQKFLTLKDQLPSVKHIVVFRESVPPALKSMHGDFILNFDQFLARANHATDDSVALRGDNVLVEHAAAVLYTSGTLGEPKGCVVSHDNLSYVAHASLMAHFQEQSMPTLMVFGQIGEASTVVLNIILPMLFVCHRRATFTVCITKPTSSTAMCNALRDARPTLIAAPAHTLTDIAAELAAAPKSDGDAKLAAWAAKVSLDASKNRQDLADIAPIKGAGMAQQVNERIRSTLGMDRCVHALGLGPVPVAVSEQLAQSGIDVLETYGTTECCGFATTSTPFHYRFGTAGVRLPGTELRVDFNEGLPQRKEGEILISGRNVMLGYIGNEQLTRRALDKDGWLRTGDLGKVDEMNLLSVTGRIKELFTTLTGERISPAVIESELKRQCPVLSNVVVVGDRRKYVVALVTLKCKKNPETGAWTDELAPEALHVNPEVLTVTTARRDKKWLDYIAQVVSVYNSQAPSPLHKVRRFCILSSDISTEEMTPTKKIKRQLVTDRCINIIEKLYAEDSPRSTTTK